MKFNPHEARSATNFRNKMTKSAKIAQGTILTQQTEQQPVKDAPLLDVVLRPPNERPFPHMSTIHSPLETFPENFPSRMTFSLVMPDTYAGT